MQDPMVTALTRPMRCVVLYGEGFTGTSGPKENHAKEYRSSNQAVIRLFINAYLRQPDVPIDRFPSFVSFIPVGVSDAQWREEGIERDKGIAIYYEVDSYFPEARGSLFVQALDAMKDDLRRQFRQRVRALRHNTVSLGLSPHEIKNPTHINQLFDAMENLERSAFTFGDKGRVVWLPATLGGGRREWFRLRPRKVENPHAARTMKNPPLPPALWRWVNGF